MTVTDAEVLLAEAPSPPLKHAVCGYTVRGARNAYRSYGAARAEAFCGASVDPLGQPPAEHCPVCVLRATGHAERCDCFKLWSPDARLPRLPEEDRPRQGAGFRGGKVPPGTPWDA